MRFFFNNRSCQYDYINLIAAVLREHTRSWLALHIHTKLQIEYAHKYELGANRCELVLVLS